MNQEDENQKQIALVFSIIFPGAGFLYQKRWITGIIFGLFHIVLTGLFLCQGAMILYRKLYGGTITSLEITVLVLILMGITLNWAFNIRKLLHYR